MKRLVLITGGLAAILGSIYAVEGGYVNHPQDPGGPTKYGVTQSVARKAGYLGDMRYFPKHCDDKNPVCADSIYIDKYIEKPGLSPIIELSPAIAEEVIDSGVNLGVVKPACWLQQSLNEFGSSPKLKVDCKIGPNTIRQLSKYISGPDQYKRCVEMLNSLDRKQEAEYRRLARAKPNVYGKFLKGWLAHRIGNVDRKLCLKDS